jgi:hypothetical protein
MAPAPISRADNDARTPPIRTIIIWIRPVIVRIGVIARPACYDRRLRRRLLIHVKINALWNRVRLGEPSAGAISPNLRVLIGGKRGGLNDIIIVAEIVKGSVTVAKYFEVDGCVANVFTVGLDSGAGFGGLYQNVVSDGPMRAAFNAWRNGLAAGKEAG